jgi:RNA recognition motif-containing protein
MNIFVSNLSHYTTEENLKDMFSAFGFVASVRIIASKKTNDQHGFAFINMPSDVEAKTALLRMNNKEIEGRTLSVSIAKEKENRLHLNLFPRPNRLV